MFENANKHFRKEDVVTPCGMSSGYFININLHHFYWQLLFLITSYCRQSCNKKSKKQDGLNQIQGFCLFKDFVMHLHEWSYKLMTFNLMMMVYTVTAHVLHF